MDDENDVNTFTMRMTLESCKSTPFLSSCLLLFFLQELCHIEWLRDRLLQRPSNLARTPQTCQETVITAFIVKQIDEAA